MNQKRTVAIILCVVALMLVPASVASALPHLNAVTSIHGNTITVTYNSPVPISIDPSTPDYETDVSTISGYVAVRVSSNENDNGGIADSNGDVNVSLSIPENTPFAIRIMNGESYNVLTHIEISNIIVDGAVSSHTYNRNLSNGFSTFLCHFYEETFGKTYERWYVSNWSKVVSNDGWLYSNDGVVNINITAHYDDGSGRTAQNVYLDVILKN